jgi:hypothetical protein
VYQMSAHTCGPWDLGPYMQDGYRVIAPNDEPFVARIVARVNTLADARVVTAAPELLQAAIQTTCPMLSLPPDVPDDELFDFAMSAGEIRAARTAVAKALGAPLPAPVRVEVEA